MVSVCVCVCASVCVSVCLLMCVRVTVYLHMHACIYTYTRAHRASLTPDSTTQSQTTHKRQGFSHKLAPQLLKVKFLTFQLHPLPSPCPLSISITPTTTAIQHPRSRSVVGCLFANALSNGTPKHFQLT